MRTCCLKISVQTIPSEQLDQMWKPIPDTPNTMYLNIGPLKV